MGGGSTKGALVIHQTFEPIFKTRTLFNGSVHEHYKHSILMMKCLTLGLTKLEKNYRAGEMIPEVGGGGLGLGGPRGNRSTSVSKGPKPPMQLVKLLKNSPREVKRTHFRYALGPPGSHPGNEINGARRGRSLPPRFLQP